jgi:hypothetical protein
MEVPTPPIWRTSTCLTLPSAAHLTTFCRLDELGLVVVGQRLEPDRAVLACRVHECASRSSWRHAVLESTGMSRDQTTV